MKIRISPLFVLLPLAVITVILAANAWVSHQRLSRFDTPIESIMDQDRRIYDLCDLSPSRLLLRAFSPEGVLRSAVFLSETGDEPEMKKTWHILGASADKVYLSTYDRINASNRHANSMIKVCDMKSGSISTLYKMEDETQTYAYAVGIVEDKLYYGHFSDDVFQVSYVDIKNGTAQEWGSVHFPFPMAWYGVTDSSALYAASVDSRIYRYEDGTWHELYRPSGRAVIASISTVGDTLYLFHAHPDDGGSLLRLDPQADTFVTVLPDIRNFLRMCVVGDNTWIAMAESFQYSLSIRGVVRSLTSLRVPFLLLWDRKTLLLTLSECLMVALLLCLARRIYLKRKISLIAKLSAVYIPIFALGAILLFSNFGRQTRDLMHNTINTTLLFRAQEVISGIDSARFSQIDWSAPLASEYYLELREDLTRRSVPYVLKWADYTNSQLHERITNVYYSYWIYRVDGSNIYTAVCGNAFISQEQRYYDITERNRGFDILLEKKTHPMFISDYDKDDEGGWLTVQYPILHDGTLVGLLDVACPGWDIDREVNAISRQATIPFIVVFAVMLAVFIVVLAVFLSALGKLKRGAVAVAGGNYAARVSVQNMDETGQIADAFNHMAESVESAISGIQAVSEGYERFVPKEMLTILGKPSIRDVRATDYVATRAMFLLLTSESFDEYKEERYLSALNRFYTRILPVLSERGGVVERFTGREMRALLDCAPAAALDTALAALTCLNQLNIEMEAEGKTPIECSIFLAYADSFLGVAGSDTRLNMLLFSRFAYGVDNIREIARCYGCRLMVEDEAFEGLGSAAARYRHRKLGYILDAGKRRALYDFFDGETAERIRDKDAVQNLFELAVDHYYYARFEQARAAFIDILKQRLDDPASREYLKKSHVRIESGESPDWLFTV